MSRVGKVIVITLMEEKYPQQWYQSFLTGVVLSETNREIRILGDQGLDLAVSFKRIFEIEEKE